MAVNLSNLRPPRGSRHRKVRVGRGIGSKLGKTAGKGNKGQKSRKGYSRRAGFEGGQMPLHRRIPKRGFHNPFDRNFTVVNVEMLNGFAAGETVTPDALVARGLMRREGDAVKVLGGGNFRRLTIFALGIMPYITASIILQLMTVVWPYLERLQKEGELGRRKITQYTRYLTVVLSAFQSFSIAITLQRSGQGGESLVYNPGAGFILMTMLTLTTGTAFIMWLGEQISDRGIGNGMSLIIFTGIVVGLPRAIIDLFEKARTNQWGPFTGLSLILLVVLMVAVVGFIVLVEGGQRRIPVQYANRVVGRRVMGGQMTYLPLRVNSGGVVPPIFASSLLTFPGTLALFFQRKFKFLDEFAKALSWGEPLYTLIYVTLIILFAFFYVGIVFNPTELADNMRKYGGVIPRIRPRGETSQNINKNFRRLAFVCGGFFALVCLVSGRMGLRIKLHFLSCGPGCWVDC